MAHEAFHDRALEWMKEVDYERFVREVKSRRVFPFHCDVTALLIGVPPAIDIMARDRS